MAQQERLFVNGPVQNGDFVIDGSPGKVLAIRLARTLNSLCDAPNTPDLWNVATLAGDKRASAIGEPINKVERANLENGIIASKYAQSSSLTPNETLTDMDDRVTALGLAIVERNLRNGTLEISDELVNTCASCGHMTGTAHTCPVCSSDSVATVLQKHLTFDRSNVEQIFTRDIVYRGFDTRYISAMAGHCPPKLILSKTRASGVPLDNIGLTDLKLDPRATLHVTSMVPAHNTSVETATMLITAKVAQQIGAYGVAFRNHEGTKLEYGVHGYVPFTNATAKEGEFEHTPSQLDDDFTYWYLNLVALTSIHPLPDNQIGPRRVFFDRIARRSIMGPTSDDEYKRNQQQIQSQIIAGNTSWIADKGLLSAAYHSHGHKRS